MPWPLLLSYVGSYWREGLLVVLLTFGVAQCRARDRAIAERASAETKLRIELHAADSVLRVVEPRLAIASVRVVHDTARVTRWLTRTDTVERWRSDTVFAAGDPSPRLAVPLPEVQRHDSLAAACYDLSQTCSAFRSYALQKFAADSVKIRAVSTVVVRSCTMPAIAGTVIGAGVGFLAARR